MVDDGCRMVGDRPKRDQKWGMSFVEKYANQWAFGKVGRGVGRRVYGWGMPFHTYVMYIGWKIPCPPLTPLSLYPHAPLSPCTPIPVYFSYFSMEMVDHELPNGR